jgi:anaerobic magnesium-protoporphyrin IX monomethyl ester cyclase
MAKILFIESAMRNEKLGIMYLSAALKQAGHDTLLCCVDMENIHDAITGFQPDWLAISLVTGTHKELLRMTKKLKRRYGLPAIAGGPHATFFPGEITEDAADFIVIGQGERAIVDIVGGNVKDRRVRYPLADLNTLPFPDRDLIYRYPQLRDNPMKNVITCRDCPYSCSYCYNHTWKKMFHTQSAFLQRRRVEDVIAEVSDLKDRYPLEQILFIDDNFLFDKQWVEEFCRQYASKIGLPFLCSFSVNLLDKGVLTKLKAAGLRMVNFALESADPAVQKQILCRRHVSTDQIVQAVDLLKTFGIRTRMQNMIGLPLKASFEDALNTLSFNRAHRVDDSWVSIFQPYPNTRLARYCKQNGFIQNDGDGCAESFFDGSRLTIDHRDKIERLQKWWYFIIRYDLPDAVVHQLLELKFDADTAEALQKLRYDFSRCYLYGLDEGRGGLDHDWQKIEAQYGNDGKLGLIEPLIRKYRLSNRLTEILINMPIPAPLTA